MVTPGKVVIITGCSTGIGKETALDLARRGCKVYMACRNMTKCNDARKEIIDKTRNSRVFSRELDLASIKSIQSFVEKYVIIIIV